MVQLLEIVVFKQTLQFAINTKINKIKLINSNYLQNRIVIILN